MMKISKTKILLVLSLTLCSALLAESLLGFGKSSLQKFESWLEQQNEQTYEANYAKALQYAESKQKSSDSFHKDAIYLVKEWEILHEAKRIQTCSDRTVTSIEYVEESLEEYKHTGILSRLLNPLVKEIKGICYNKGQSHLKHKRKDLFSKANELLNENTKSFNHIEYIEVAEDFLAKNEHPELEQILRDFVALRPIVEQKKEGKLICSDENMNLIKTMQDTMINSSPKGSLFTVFDKAREGEHFKQIIITITEQLGEVCLKPLAEKFVNLEPALDENRVRALKQFTSSYGDNGPVSPLMLVVRARIEKPINLSKKAALDWADKFVRMNVALYGEEKLCQWDPLEQKNTVPVELVREKYDDLVVKTCNYILEERKEIIPILEETLRVAKYVMLYKNTLPGAFANNGLADVAANYVVCKRLKDVDQSKLIENIAKNLPRAESDFGLNKVVFDIRRSDVESGC